MPQIRAEFGLDEPETIRLLASVDRLGLIESLPRNRVRVRVPRDFPWRQDGPVRTRYMRTGMREFLRDAFDDRDATLRMEVKEFGDASIAILGRRREQLVGEFNESVGLDASLLPDRRRSVGLLLALRPWVFSLLDSLRADEASTSPQFANQQRKSDDAHHG